MGARASLLLLAVPAFTAAWLLFAIEPMMGRLLLPALGGSPATWASCLVAFQALLLAGYAYAYVGARVLSVPGQALLHLLLTSSAALLVFNSRLSAPIELGPLPLALAVPWLVVERVGVPFSVLASTTPLLARWAPVWRGSGANLYAVSNAGALLGLLCYPLLLERWLSLPTQLALWAGVFVVLCFMVAPAAVGAARSSSRQPWRSRPRVSGRQRLRWVAWAAVPSALLLAITSYLTVDVAATPLLWVTPMALYLASFVVAFGPLNARAREPALLLWGVGSGWLSLNALSQGKASLGAEATAALLALLGGCLLCHGELARERPHGDESGYYLLVATGGVLGGAFVSLLAPLIFSDTFELEVASCALFLLLLGVARRRGPGAWSRRSRVLFFLGLGLCLPLVLGETLLRSAARNGAGRVIARRRSFLGPLRVVETAEGRVLTHGRIQHGMQLRAPAQRRTPTMYFAANSAVARVLRRELGHPQRWGVVGLGVGTLAAYGRARDRVTFYELDENVAELARRDFTFLKDSAASVDVRIGDGRLLLAREAPQCFDVLVLDAFSSDAVPVHLLTREAFELYAQKLAPQGILLANVSNRHLALERVVRGSGRAAGMWTQVVDSPGSEREHTAHVKWAVLARNPSALETALADARVERAGEPEVSWTDSRASVLSVLR